MVSFEELISWSWLRRETRRQNASGIGRIKHSFPVKIVLANKAIFKILSNTPASLDQNRGCHISHITVIHSISHDMLLYNTAAEVLPFPCELHPTFLIFKQPQSFSRLLQYCTRKNHLVTLTHYVTFTRLHCHLREVGYLEDIVDVVTSITKSSPQQLCLLCTLTSVQKRYQSTMLPLPLLDIEVSFEQESGQFLWFEAKVTDIVPVATVQGIFATGYLTYTARYGYSEGTSSVNLLQDGTLQDTTSSDGPESGE